MVNLLDTHLSNFIRGVIQEGSEGNSRSYFDDPTTLGFNIFFEFDSESSPLLNTSDKGESAVKYLRSVDEPEHAQSLQNFITRLQDLVRSHPYFFQSISGLENLYTMPAEKGYDNERIITINTLESLDLRIGALIESYFSAYFDIKYRRERIPENLRNFRLVIIISEIRKIRTFVRGITGTDVSNFFPFNMKDISDNLNSYVYIFNNCTFDFGESNPSFGSLMNTAPEQAVNSFRIKTGAMETRHKMGFLDLVANVNNVGQPESLKSTSSTFDKPDKNNLLKQIETDFKNQVGEFGNVQNATVRDFFKRESSEFLRENDPRRIASLATNKAEAFLDSKIKQFLLGNVFFSPTGNNFDEKLFDVATGNASINTLNPLAGRIGDPAGKIADIILNSGKQVTPLNVPIDQKSVNPSGLGDITTSNLSSDPQTLHSVPVDQLSSDPNNLSSVPVDQLSTDPNNIGVVQVDALSPDVNNIGTVGLNGQSNNPQNIGTVGLNGLSTDPNNIGVVQVDEQSENAQNIGQVSLNPATINPSHIATINLDTMSSDVPFIGDIQLDNRSQNQNHIGEVENSNKSNNSTNLNSVNVPKIGKDSLKRQQIILDDKSHFATGLDKVNTGKLSDKNLFADKLSVGDLSEDELSQVKLSVGDKSANVDNLNSVSNVEISKNADTLDNIKTHTSNKETLKLQRENVVSEPTKHKMPIRVDVGKKSVNASDLQKIDAGKPHDDVKQLGHIELVKREERGIKSLDVVKVKEVEPVDFTKLFMNNVLDYEKAPFSTLLTTITVNNLTGITSDLGNVFTNDTQKTNQPISKQNATEDSPLGTVIPRGESKDC